MAKRAAREAPPPAQLAAFERAVAGVATLAPAYLLRGEEPYFRRRALEALRRRAGELEWEVELHDAADPDYQLQRLLGDLATPPLFASGQLLIARDVDEALQGTAKQRPPLWRALVEFLERGESRRTVVLAVGNLRANHGLVSEFEERGLPSLVLRKLWDSPPPWNPDPRQTELVQWLVARARELGLRLDPAQAVYVAAATGNDLDALEGQLERLRSGGPRRLEELVRWQSGGSPFAAADALCRGDLPRATDALVALFGGGMQGKGGERVVDEAALGAILVGSLWRGLRQGSAAARALAQGSEPAAAAAAAGAAQDRARAELVERLRRRPDPASWAQMLEDLAEVDRRAKSGAGLDVHPFLWLALRWAVPARPAP